MPPRVQVREGYEIWHPNREKAESKTTKGAVAVILVASALLIAIVTLAGWERLQSPGVGVITLIWAGLYVFFAVLVVGWNRGLLPVAAALAVIMAIFAAVAAPGWFARDKVGFDAPALPGEVLGLLTAIIVPVQLALLIVALLAFNQEWNVEEERPVGGRGGSPGDNPSGGWHEPPGQTNPAH